MRSLAGKTIFLTGGSRGIGLAIALRAARDGANVAIAAKTTEPHPRLEGTIFTAAEAIEAAGGQALPIKTDIRHDDEVQAAIDATVERFGGLDIVVNNASAIQLTGTVETAMKRFDLMHQVNTRGTYLVSQRAIPHLLQADNPHVLNLAPPLNLSPHWFGNHVAYTMAKYGMSMCVLGMAEEFKRQGIAFNALWPRTTIATAAVKNLLGGDMMVARSRTPEILADAAWHVLTRPSRACTGNFFLDEEVLATEGITDLSGYKVDPELPEDELVPDLFL